MLDRCFGGVTSALLDEQIGIEVEYELSFVRYTLTFAYYETESSSAGARVVHLVAWCILSGHHVMARAAVQDNLDHDIFPVFDGEDGFEGYETESCRWDLSRWGLFECVWVGASCHFPC